MDDSDHSNSSMESIYSNEIIDFLENDVVEATVFGEAIAITEESPQISDLNDYSGIYSNDREATFFINPMAGNDIYLLLELVTNNRFHEVINILRKSPELLQGSTWRGNSALMSANSFEMVSMLLDMGAEIDQRDALGWTALMWASCRGNKEIVQILLEHGSNPNAQSNEDGSTALMLAIARNYVHIVEILVEHGVNVKLRTHSGDTVLSIACKHGDYQCIQGLLQSPQCNLSYLNEVNNNVTGKNKQGYTPLEILSINANNLPENLTLWKRLLKIGAELTPLVLSNVQDPNIKTELIEVWLSRCLLLSRIRKKLGADSTTGDIHPWNNIKSYI